MSGVRFATAGVRVDLVLEDTGAGGGTPGSDAAWTGLVALVRDVGAGMLADDEAPGDRSTPRHTLVVSRDADARLVFGGSALDRDPRVAAATLLAAVDRVALAHTPCLAVHAAAVAGAVGAAVVPGVSGSGKSTLAGACMRRGLRLVSDEAACLDRLDLALRPHPRPLGLSAHSRRLLSVGDIGADAGGAPQPDRHDDERATAPGALGRWVPTQEHCPVALVVLARREPGVLARLVPASRSDGLAALLGSCLNTGTGAGWRPGDAWHLLGRLVQSVSVVALTYDRPQDGAALLADELSARPATR